MEDNKALKQIYHALELRQFSKAIKLSLVKPQSEWPIVIALRAHCLERSGRIAESLCTIRDLMAALFPSSSVQWQDLIEERIWALKELEEPSTAVDPIMATHAPLTSNSATLKKGQVQKVKNIEIQSSDVELSLIDIIDLPRWKRQQVIQSQSNLRNVSPMVIMGGTEAIVQEVSDAEIIFR